MAVSTDWNVKCSPVGWLSAVCVYVCIFTNGSNIELSCYAWRAIRRIHCCQKQQKRRTCTLYWVKCIVNVVRMCVLVMATFQNTMHVSEHSADGKLYALLSSDGKLKIWNTESNEFQREFVPNLHLNAPFTCFTWITVSGSTLNDSRKVCISIPCVSCCEFYFGSFSIINFNIFIEISKESCRRSTTNNRLCCTWYAKWRC